MRVVAAHFTSTLRAEAALAELERAGFTADEISYMTRDVDTTTLRQRLLGRVEPTSHTAVGTAAGGVSGMLLGLAALALPGVGPVMASGALVAALVGASVGAAAGGLVGALSDMGVPKAEAEAWAERMQTGGAMVVVRAELGDAALAEAILRDTGGDTAAGTTSETAVAES